MKTHEQFVDEMLYVNKNIEILGRYNGANTKIKVKCKICGEVWEAIPSNLLRGTNCPKCHCNNIDISKTIANTHPHLSKLLYEKEDAYKYSYGSKEKVDWICPYCGEVVKGISIQKIVSRKHIPCKKCSDGISYPNKFMASLLRQLNVDFESEYSPNWIFPKRYDFYISKYNIIIEMDGAIGHGGKTFDGKDGTDLYNTDVYKDNVALSKGINVIRIDSKVSEKDYISKNILSSLLADYFDLSAIDWEKCEKDSLSSMMIRTIELWNKLEDIQSIMNSLSLSRVTVLRYLHKGDKLGLCNYNPQNQMEKSGRSNISSAYEKTKIPVICLDNNMIFDSIKEANIWLGLNAHSHGITDNCRGIAKSSGKDPLTNKPLHWSFYNKDYIGGLNYGG